MARSAQNQPSPLRLPAGDVIRAVRKAVFGPLGAEAVEIETDEVLSALAFLAGEVVANANDVANARQIFLRRFEAAVAANRGAGRRR